MTDKIDSSRSADPQLLSELNLSEKYEQFIFFFGIFGYSASAASYFFCYDAFWWTLAATIFIGSSFSAESESDIDRREIKRKNLNFNNWVDEKPGYISKSEDDACYFLTKVVCFLVGSYCFCKALPLLIETLQLTVANLLVAIP